MSYCGFCHQGLPRPEAVAADEYLREWKRYHYTPPSKASLEQTIEWLLREGAIVSQEADKLRAAFPLLA